MWRFTTFSSEKDAVPQLAKVSRHLRPKLGIRVGRPQRIAITPYVQPWFDFFLFPLPLCVPDRVRHQFLEERGPSQGARKWQMSLWSLVNIVDELVRTEPPQLAFDLHYFS